jgi:hypothetical protein
LKEGKYRAQEVELKSVVEFVIGLNEGRLRKAAVVEMELGGMGEGNGKLGGRLDCDGLAALVKWIGRGGFRPGK